MAGWTSRSLFAARLGKQQDRDRDGKALFLVGESLRYTFFWIDTNCSKDSQLYVMLWIIIACIGPYVYKYIGYFYPYMLWIFIFILDYLHPGMTRMNQLALRIDSEDSGSRGRTWICVLKLVVKLDHAKHARHGICLFGMYMILLVTSDYTCLHIHDFLVLQEEFHFELYKETLQELGFSQKDLRLGGFLWVQEMLDTSTVNGMLRR